VPEPSAEPEWLPGNVSGALRVGDRVHRATGPWTPAVHALLDFLAPRLPHVPRGYGLDGQGREVLDHLSGRVVDIDTERLTEGQIRSLVTWTREFHAAVAGFTHPGPWRMFPVHGPTLVGHNDIAPYNACFEGDELVGVFDWDFSGPTNPLAELAFIAWNCVPLWEDIGASLAAQRVSLIASTYGGFAAREVLYAVPARIQVMLDGIPAGAAAGDPGLANLVAKGEVERSAAALADLVERIPGIAAFLG
jgi:hypothetical protein